MKLLIIFVVLKIVLNSTPSSAGPTDSGRSEEDTSESSSSESSDPRPQNLLTKRILEDTVPENRPFYKRPSSLERHELKKLFRNVQYQDDGTKSVGAWSSPPNSPEPAKPVTRTLPGIMGIAGMLMNALGPIGKFIYSVIEMIVNCINTLMNSGRNIAHGVRSLVSGDEGEPRTRSLDIPLPPVDGFLRMFIQTGQQFIQTGQQLFRALMNPLMSNGNNNNNNRAKRAIVSLVRQRRAIMDTVQDMAAIAKIFMGLYKAVEPKQ